MSEFYREIYYVRDEIVLPYFTPMKDYIPELVDMYRDRNVDVDEWYNWWLRESNSPEKVATEYKMVLEFMQQQPEIKIKVGVEYVGTLRAG